MEVTTEAQHIAVAQQARWQAMNVEVTDRGTPRLPQFRKNFSGTDLDVKIRDPQTGEYGPYLLRSGRTLKAHECLPERADLALDEQGHLIDQAEFEQRYRQYLDSFVMPSDANPHFEPVPNVARYINARPDHFTASKGMIEIDFEPGQPGDFKPKFYVDEQGNSIPVEEFEAKQSEKAAHSERIEQLLVMLAENQIGKDQIVAVTETDGEPKAEPVVPVEEQQAATTPANKEQAACGKWVKAGYVAQHVRHCKDEACNPVGDGDEAA